MRDAMREFSYVLVARAASDAPYGVARGRPGVDSELMEPLARATTELRAVAVVWSLTGMACIGGAIASGDLDAVDLAVAAALLVLTVAGALVGRRTALQQGTAERLSDVVPAAHVVPVERAEPTVKSRVRGSLVALVLVAGTAMLWAMALALILALVEAPSSLPRLLSSTALLTGAWALLCGGAALLLARWFSAKETRMDALILVEPLHSGQPKPVYFRASPR